MLWREPTAVVVQSQRLLGLVPAEVIAAWSGVTLDEPRRLLVRGVLPVLGHAFVHGSVIAVVVNAFFLLTFGRELEARCGTSMLALVFAAGVAAGAAAHLTARPAATVPAVGAAAAVSAVIGASLWCDARSRVVVAVPVVVVPVLLRLPVAAVVAAWFALQLEPLQELLAMGACQPLSWPALAAGLASGVATGPLCRLRQRVRASASRTPRTDSKPTRRPFSSKGRWR